jgi:hypothetical protein
VQAHAFCKFLEGFLAEHLERLDGSDELLELEQLLMDERRQKR